MRSSPSWRPATTILGATCGRPRAKISCAKSTPPDARSPLALPNATLFPIHHTSRKAGDGQVSPLVLRPVELALDPGADVPRALDLRQAFVENELGDASCRRDSRLQN